MLKTKGLNDYLNISSDTIINSYLNNQNDYWKKSGQKMVIELFQQMAERVPAYKDFLKKNKVDAEKVTSFEDIQNIPPIDKPSYIDAYPLDALCWDGELANSHLISTSSGSTGISYLWPRSSEQTLQIAIISEILYREFFEVHRRKTLFIITFAMGTWAAGTSTLMATDWVAEKGYPITIVTPGMDKTEILRIVKEANKYYEQLIFVGYPPFIKDVIDSGLEQGINWQQLRLKFFLGGESFTENWRSHIQNITGLKNPLTDIVNMYASADVGLMAHETALTILLRRLAASDSKILEGLFTDKRLPSVNQFDPRLRFFESHQGELLVSARSGIPLLRYNTKDVGDVLYFEDVKLRCLEQRIDLQKEFNNVDSQRLLWQLPIVYLFGRGKFSATIYATNIYPEYVKVVLDHPNIINQTTGKFHLKTEEEIDYSQSLHLHIELKEGVEPNDHIADEIKRIFIAQVSQLSSEYSDTISIVGAKAYPKVALYKYGNSNYFPVGVTKKHA